MKIIYHNAFFVFLFYGASSLLYSCTGYEHGEWRQLQISDFCMQKYESIVVTGLFAWQQASSASYVPKVACLASTPLF